jgi:hypothetical protein
MPYRVVWQDAASLFIVYCSGQTESGEIITFVSRSTYYVQRGGYVEFFSKAGVACQETPSK